MRDVFFKSLTSLHVQNYDYDPYGNPIAAPPPGQAPTTDIRFAGMYYHTDSGLYLTQSGVYDPLIGRWLSRDMSDIDNEASPNPYAFAQSDPVNAVGFLCLNGTTCGPEKPWSEWTAPDRRARLRRRMCGIGPWIGPATRRYSLSRVAGERVGVKGVLATAGQPRTRT